jgi:hypothetical protein
MKRMALSQVNVNFVARKVYGSSTTCTLLSEFSRGGVSRILF